jgi:hypothetical protein
MKKDDPEEPALYKAIMNILETGEETMDTVEHTKSAAGGAVRAVADVHGTVNATIDKARGVANFAKKGKKIIEKLDERAQPRSTFGTLLDWGNVIFGEDSDD